jgi:two-component system response regulator AtoC
MRESGSGKLIGQSASMVELRADIQRIGHSTARVLITGESGVGKEVVARGIYDASGSGAPFVPVNCAGIPETLLESELFGHVKGSFTGAHRDQAGKLEMPGGGTILLDEMGEMTLRMQALFLRYLETGEVQKVGAERSAPAKNVRIIAATNRDLRQQIAQGLFREDLFYRLNVIHLHVPPLRDRREDIPLLLDHFLAAFTEGRGGGAAASNGYGTRVRAIAPKAVALLTQYSWPGNVRELQNLIERAVVTGRREVIGPEDLPAEVRATPDHAVRVRNDQHSATTDDLYRKLIEDRESFWTAVYPLYMNREITKGNIRELIDKALNRARGNYKIVLAMFNMEPREYKRFLNFLRKHDCQLPFMAYRQ